MFFDFMKRKIRRKNIWRSISSILVLGFLIFWTVSTILSPEKQVTLPIVPYSEGLPVPKWLAYCFFAYFIYMFSVFLIISMKDLFTNASYNKMIKAAQAIGDVAFVEQTLASLPKDERSRDGDLKYNELLFLYWEGTDVFLIPTKNIDSIGSDSGRYKDTRKIRITSQGEEIKIETKEADLDPLLNDIRSCIETARLSA